MSINYIMALFLVLSWSFPSTAQDTTALDTVVVSKEVVISSSRIPQTSAGSGRHITIVPEQTIRELPAHTTDEVLRYISGVEMQPRGPFGSQSDFSLRGSTFSQVLVMVDGMRINDPLTAHFNSYIPVAPSEIKHIEVLHGPAAAQYGADAVGGVVNIVTKTFGAYANNDHNSANLEIGYGQDDLKTGKGGFFTQQNRYRLGGGGMWYHSPGQQLTPDYKNRFNNGNISVSGGVALNEQWDLAIRSGYDHRDFNARYFYTASPYDDATEKVNAWWNQVRLQRSTENSSTTLKGSYKHNRDRYVFNSQTPANVHTTQLASLQINQYRKLSNNWEWSYGLQGMRRLIRSTDRGDHGDWQYAAFSMLQWQPINSVTASASLRLDNDENYGTELMPQLSLSYQKERWVLRMAGGRSVRSASYTERFISTNLDGPLTGGRNLGNPWLEAERAWSAELGADLFPIPNVQLSATGFVRSSSNLIDYVLTNSSEIRNDGNIQPDTDYLYAQNINSIQTAGVETELSATRDLQSILLTGSISYSYTDFFGDENIASKYVSTYARHLVNGSLRMQFGKFETALSGLWKQRQSARSESLDVFKSSSYSLWNASIDYEIARNISFGMQIDNVFDNEYQDVLGARMPGRWVLGTMSWQL